MSKQAGKEMLSWCISAGAKIDMVENTARGKALPIIIHLGAELANTRDAIAELEEQIKEWAK